MSRYTYGLLLCVVGLNPTMVMGLPIQQQIVQEKPVLVLYYSPYCPYSAQVLNYLKKIHKTVTMKNVREDPQALEELRVYGGKLFVPCLLIDGQPLYRADAIIDWMSLHQDDLSNREQA